MEELLRRYYPELYGNESSGGGANRDTKEPEIKPGGNTLAEKRKGKEIQSNEIITKQEAGEDSFHSENKRRKIEDGERESNVIRVLKNSPDLTDDSSLLPEDEDEDTATEEEDDEDEEGDDENVTEEDPEGDEDVEDENNTKLLVEGGEEFSEFSDVIEMAAKFQPTGNTLDTTTVKTKIPFLLKHKMREYQHIGLDWLVSMYERKLNGILADEMGLGKTIETIALLAHLACEKEVWGPHLIVVPTSVMLNWEMEIKKWAPAFKIVTYYGNQKERRLKRVGWSKPNAFHICITSYKLVTQDHQR